VDWIHVAQAGSIGMLFACGNETLGSVKGGEFLD